MDSQNPDTSEMAKGNFNALIVEDDVKFGQALAKALNAKGIAANHVSNPEAALTICQHEDFSVLVIDCMLPRLDGVTLVQNLRSDLKYSPNVVLMTGIFKDKGFLKEAQLKTSASLVLSKPFDIEELISHLEKIRDDLEVTHTGDSKGILELLASPQTTAADFEYLIGTSKEFDGREIPFLIALALKTKISGALHLLLPEGQNGAIYFNGGEIEHVQLKDAKSLFGHILMDLGYLEPEDLEEALKMSSKVPLGQKLIHQMSISPHAVDLALSEQSIVRISQLVVPEMLELSFSSEEKTPIKMPKALSLKRLNQLFRDWSRSKYDEDYLEEKFKPIIASLRSNPVTKSLTFQEMCYHILSGEAAFQFEKLRQTKGNPQKERFERLASNMKSMNDFQVLGVTAKASSAEIKTAYTLLADSLKKNYENAENTQVKEVQIKVAQRLKNAYQNLKDDTVRSNYLKELEARSQLEVLQREPELFLAIDLIAKKDYVAALELLRKLQQENLKFRDLQSYLIIAESKANKQNIREQDLLRVPPENRHSAGYLVAKGLSLKGAKSYEMAIQSFKKALVYEPSLKLAKLEIRSCLSRLEKQKSSGGTFSIGDIFGKSNKKAS